MQPWFVQSEANQVSIISVLWAVGAQGLLEGEPEVGIGQAFLHQRVKFQAQLLVEKVVEISHHPLSHEIDVGESSSFKVDL